MIRISMPLFTFVGWTGLCVAAGVLVRPVRYLRRRHARSPR